jgi:hypothetical protein
VVTKYTAIRNFAIRNIFGEILQTPLKCYRIFSGRSVRQLSGNIMQLPLSGVDETSQYEIFSRNFAIRNIFAKLCNQQPYIFKLLPYIFRPKRPSVEREYLKYIKQRPSQTALLSSAECAAAVAAVAAATLSGSSSGQASSSTTSSGTDHRASFPNLCLLALTTYMTMTDPKNVSKPCPNFNYIQSRC